MEVRLPGRCLAESNGGAKGRGKRARWDGLTAAPRDFSGVSNPNGPTILKLHATKVSKVTLDALRNSSSMSL